MKVSVESMSESIETIVSSSPGSALPIASFGDIIDDRHSCRAFKSDPIPTKQIETILRAAQQAPSWCNSQGWAASITRGAGTRRLSEALLDSAWNQETSPEFDLPRSYTGPRLDRRRAAGFALYGAAGVNRDDKAGRERQALENYTFFGAPHVAVVSVHDELGPYALVDVGIYIATFCYTAQALGIGTVVQAAIAMHAGAVRSAIEIPVDHRIVCAISFGTADSEHPANRFRTERESIDQVVSWVTD